MDLYFSTLRIFIIYCFTFYSKATTQDLLSYKNGCFYYISLFHKKVARLSVLTTKKPKWDERLGKYKRRETIYPKKRRNYLGKYVLFEKNSCHIYLFFCISFLSHSNELALS